MNHFTQRKRLLVAQAGVHRQLIALEQRQLSQRLDDTRERLLSKRWWLIGGTLTAGWFMTRKLPLLARWLPMAMPAWRLARGLLPRQ